MTRHDDVVAMFTVPKSVVEPDPDYPENLMFPIRRAVLPMLLPPLMLAARGTDPGKIEVHGEG